MDIRFDSRVVILTGAAQGIGRGIAAAFKEAGASVHLADIDEDGVRKTAEELGARAYAGDLSDRVTAASVVDEVIAAERRLDILVLAAGGVCGQVGRPLDEISPADWHAVFAANVDGAFWSVQSAAPVMKKAGWGRVVTISSTAGLRPSLTGIQAYSAAKHALVGLTKQLSGELAPHGITVNSIAPGLILSNPSTVEQWQSYGPERQSEIVDSLHTRRLGSPQDIAAAALFLSSEQASWITGQILPVDGGRF